MKKKKAVEMLLLTFAGEHITVYLKDKIKKVIETSKGLEEITHPMAVEGYVIDIDDHWIYMSEREDGDISSCIRKLNVALIELTKMSSKHDDILEAFPVPTDKNQIC